MVPKATVLATATAMSRFDALIAGAKAVMAVTPQMDVPAVKRYPNSGETVLLRELSHGMTTNPAPTDATTTGKHVAVVVHTCHTLSLAATQTMPVCRMLLVAKVVPG